MTISEQIKEVVDDLPPEKQRQVMAFVRTLREQPSTTPAPPVPPVRSVKGDWAHLKMDITDEDIDQARREMWRNFPRDID
jgi:hypothetical protein